MLLGYSQSLSVHLILLVHRDCLFRLFGSQVALFSLCEVILLLVGFGLFELDADDTLRVVLASDLDSRVPVSLMLIHIDGLLWLIGLNELFFSFFEPVVILEMKGELQMNIWELVAGMVLSKSESIVKPL